MQEIKRQETTVTGMLENININGQTHDIFIKFYETSTGAMLLLSIDVLREPYTLCFEDELAKLMFRDIKVLSAVLNSHDAVIKSAKRKDAGSLAGL